MNPTQAYERARENDAFDPLARFRREFRIDDEALIYLDGNSLGRLPNKVIGELDSVVRCQWGGRLVRSWPEGWINLPNRLAAKIARLIGAKGNEVLVCDSTSVNLYKLVMAALSLRGDRTEILTDDTNFPSDLYLLQGCAHQTGCTVTVVGAHEIRSQIGPQTALVCLTHTSFKSGEMQAMQEITEVAHQAGSLMLWDLSHSVGAVPIDLNGCHVDLAVGCCYKYLNGGPGAPAFLYVHEDVIEKVRSPIWGWFGQNRPFDFGLTYEPAHGIQRMMAGTPPILSMVAIEAGVDLLLDAGMDEIRTKSVAQTTFFIELWEVFLAPLGVELQSPRDTARRGSHISLGHPNAYQIDQALIHEANVIPDFRTPDNIRFGVTPLYTTFMELAEATFRFQKILQTESYKKYACEQNGVT